MDTLCDQQWVTEATAKFFINVSGSVRVLDVLRKMAVFFVGWPLMILMLQIMLLPLLHVLVLTEKQLWNSYE